MENYADYLRCGEIYKSPSQSERSPYILKCFKCEDVFMLLESFIFHIEDYCKQEEAASSAPTLQSGTAYEGRKQFGIQMVKEVEYPIEYHELKHYNDPHVEEDDDVSFVMEEEVAAEPFTSEARNKTNGLDSTDECEIIEDSSVEVRDELLEDNGDECIEEVDVYVSDIFDVDVDNEEDANVNQNNANLSSEEKAENFGIQETAEDTESADEDLEDFNDDSTLSSSSNSEFIRKFIELPANVFTFIITYKNQPKLWNRKLFPYSDDIYKTGLDKFTKELNKRLKLELSNNTTSEIMSYLLKTYNDDLKGIRISTEGKPHKPLWYFKHMRFLKPFMESDIFSSLDRSLPPMLPEQTIDIITIYRTFPHLWNSSLAEYCCKNKRSESELEMLHTLQFRINLKLTQTMLQKLIRCIHGYFSKEKYKHLESNTEVTAERPKDNQPNYYWHLQFLYDHVAPFKCTVCTRYFKSPFIIKTHMAKHTGSIPLTCSICKKRFKTIGPYVSHARRHMDDCHEVCNICSKKFLTVDELETHKASHSKVIRYKCTTCGSTFENMMALSVHKKVHEKRILYKCRMCDKIFRNKETVESHMEIQHQKAGCYSCKTCERRFMTSKALLAHEAMHMDMVKYKCKKCAKGFITKLSYVCHMRTHRQNSIQGDKNGS